MYMVKFVFNLLSLPQQSANRAAELELYKMLPFYTTSTKILTYFCT